MWVESFDSIEQHELSAITLEGCQLLSTAIDIHLSHLVQENLF